MRQNPRLNNENKQLMEEILRQTVAMFPTPEFCLPFIGTILYLKKIGAELIDVQSGTTILNQSAKLENLLVDDSLRDVILDVSRIVTCSVGETELEHILLPFTLEEFHPSEYLYWYDYVIENTSRNKNLVNQPTVPRELSILAEAFIGNNAKNALVPFGGIMNYATEFDCFDSIDAYEFNRQTWQIGMLRLGLAGVVSKVRFSALNIEHWPSNKYDTIISMPPFGMRIKMSTPSTNYETATTEEAELIAPCRFIESTNENGVCVAFAPVSLLFDGASKKRFRKWAMEKNIIDTVILLPNSLLVGTSIPLACIILRKTPYQNGGIRMIDASGFYTNHQNRNHLEVGDLMEAYHTDIKNVSRTVLYKDIQDMDFSWDVNAYLQEALICPDGFNISLLEDLVSLPHLETATIGDKGLVVKVSDLSDDWSRPYVHLENMEQESISRAYACLDREAILVSTIRTLKPSIIKASKECPVWINPNILVICPNNTIDAEYLCMKLAELTIHTIGVGVPHISKRYLLRQKIVYPELSVQKSLFIEGSRTLALAKARDMGLQEVINQMKADYINEVRARKHDMKTPMTQLRNTLTLIKELVGEIPEEYAYRLNKYVERQQKAMNVLSDIVTHIADEDKYATPEIVDIESVLKSFETTTDRYVIEYRRDNASLLEAGIETPRLRIGKVDFVRLSQNIISNAIRRGFVKDNAEYALNITLSVEKNFFVIDFSNNGEPLPEGMDKARYGTKGAKGTDSDGSGTGGYIVKSITQHYGGDFDIFSSKFANMDFTNVIVKLPIYREEDE